MQQIYCVRGDFSEILELWEESAVFVFIFKEKNVSEICGCRLEKIRQKRLKKVLNESESRLAFSNCFQYIFPDPFDALVIFSEDSLP